MQKKDYYGILGVARDAGESVIRMAYRRLALQNHPDTNREDPKAEDRFKEINEAYDVLSHRDKRNLYDRGSEPLAGGFHFRPSPFDSWSDPFEEGFFRNFDAEEEDSEGALDVRGEPTGEPAHSRPVPFPIDPISSFTIFP